MQRDHSEWRRPWTSDDASAATLVAQEPAIVRTPSVAAPGANPWAAQSGTSSARPRPLAPPASWHSGDATTGSAIGSGQPSDDTPTRTSGRSRGMVVALLAGLLGAVIGTATTLAVDTNGQEIAGPASQVSGGVQAPAINLGDLRNTGTVVPAVAEAVLPSVVRVDINGNAGGAEQQIGLGSGVVYRSDGYIITNNHVVEQASSLDVKLTNGDEYDAEVVGTDPRNDLAVLHIDATGLPAINLRTDAPPIVGETAIAIGSPFGLDASVTAGVISATGRDLKVPATNGSATFIPAVIQTDAAINPGNSGGALVDQQGQLLGINTAILTGSGGSQGVGFAIPVGQAVASADQLIATGQVQYPLLGVVGKDVPQQMAQRLGLDRGAGGAVITEIQPNTAAADAGLARDDVIVALDDAPIGSMSDLVVAVRGHKPRDVVALTYLRNGQRTTVDVTLGELPESP